MKTSLHRFALIAAVGLSLFALGQNAVQAQFFRPPVPPVRPVARRPIVVPPVRSFTNPYVLPGVTLNQLAVLDVLSMSGGLPPYYNPYLTPYGRVNPYLTTSLPITTYTTRVTVPGLPYNPYAVYNPYFAAYGLYP